MRTSTSDTSSDRRRWLRPAPVGVVGCVSWRHQPHASGCQPVTEVTNPTRYDTMASVELAFRTRALRARCEDPTTGRINWTPDVQEQLRNRLADLRAADSPLELIVGAPQLVEGPRPRIEVKITDQHIMVCHVNHASVPRDTQAKVQWNKIYRIRVDEIRRIQ